MVPLAVVALFGAAVLVRVDFSSREAMLPTCDSYLGVTELRDFVARSPEGKASGLELKTLTDIKKSADPHRAELHRDGPYEHGSAVPIGYRFILKDGQRRVKPTGSERRPVLADLAQSARNHGLQ